MALDTAGREFVATEFMSKVTYMYNHRFVLRFGEGDRRSFWTMHIAAAVPCTETGEDTYFMGSKHM